MEGVADPIKTKTYQAADAGSGALEEADNMNCYRCEGSNEENNETAVQDTLNRLGNQKAEEDE
eukprot:8041827-Alexandrium_andersonii.AAC.1